MESSLQTVLMTMKNISPAFKILNVFKELQNYSEITHQFKSQLSSLKPSWLGYAT